MDFSHNKHNFIKYLPTNNDKDIWKMSISGVGFQSIKPKDNYPPKGHPIGYTFNPERGRIIDEFTLVYIIKGEGKFLSVNCLLYPGEWHSYQPAKDIGWDEYFVAFQGEYFDKLLNKITHHENPIFHIGINDQIVKRIPGGFSRNYNAHDRTDLFDQ